MPNVVVWVVVGGPTAELLSAGQRNGSVAEAGERPHDLP